MIPSPAISLHALREKTRRWPSPVIVFNKSHSGSRMLAELLASAGIFMGAHVNESWDSLDLLDLTTRLVRDYYPDYAPLWRPGAANEEMAALAAQVFDRHRQGIELTSATLWGWKLCETLYTLPVIDFCFPDAKYIHLIRDGRDVAFCDHKAPDEAFWKKVYFNTDRINAHHGMPLTARAYRRQSPVFNAIHWVNSVTIGRSYGMMLRERYLEVRYEDLCLDFDQTARRVLAFAGIANPTHALDAMKDRIHTSSIAKHRRRSSRDQRQVMSIIKPLLLSLGYMKVDREPSRGQYWRLPGVDGVLGRFRKSRQTQK